MKNVTKSFWVIVLVVLIGISMNACDNGMIPGSQRRELQGTWYGRNPISPHTDHKVLRFSGGRFNLRYYQDGQLTHNISGTVTYSERMLFFSDRNAELWRQRYDFYGDAVIFQRSWDPDGRLLYYAPWGFFSRNNLNTNFDDSPFEGRWRQTEPPFGAIYFRGNTYQYITSQRSGPRVPFVFDGRYITVFNGYAANWEQQFAFPFHTWRYELKMDGNELHMATLDSRWQGVAVR